MILVVIATTVALDAPPAEFTERAAHYAEFYDEVDEETYGLSLTVASRRLQPNEFPVTWPSSYSYGYFDGPWAGLAVYNISGGIDEDELAFEFAVTEGATTVPVTPIDQDGEVALTVVASQRQAAFGRPSLSGSSSIGYQTDAAVFDPGVETYLGASRPLLYPGFVGGLASEQWSFSPAVRQSIAMTMVISASSRMSDDEGGGAPVGTRVPI